MLLGQNSSNPRNLTTLVKMWGSMFQLRLLLQWIDVPVGIEAPLAGGRLTKVQYSPETGMVCLQLSGR